MLAATAGLRSLPFRKLGITLSGEATLGPKAAFANYDLYAFKPPWILGVVICKIKGLLLLCQGIKAIAHAWPIQVMHPEMLGIWGTHQQAKAIKKRKSRHMFDHFSGREGVICTFEVARHVVEQEETLDVAIYFGPKDVDCMIDLHKECRCVEISVAIFSRLEHNASLSVVM